MAPLRFLFSCWSALPQTSPPPSIYIMRFYNFFWLDFRKRSNEAPPPHFHLLSFLSSATISLEQVANKRIIYTCEFHFICKLLCCEVQQNGWKANGREGEAVWGLRHSTDSLIRGPVCQMIWSKSFTHAKPRFLMCKLRVWIDNFKVSVSIRGFRFMSSKDQHLAVTTCPQKPRTIPLLPRFLYISYSHHSNCGMHS